MLDYGIFKKHDDMFNHFNTMHEWMYSNR